MSVNLIYAMNPEKVRKFGKYFGTIDFHPFSTNRSQLRQKEGQVTVGELEISGKRFKLTMDELDNLIYDCQQGICSIKGQTWDLNQNEFQRMIETLQNAKLVFFQKYRFGM